MRQQWGMEAFLNAVQLAVALGLINVWIIRLNKKTAYRGGNSTNLKEEFEEYGLPAWFFYLIGFLKLGSAAALIAGFFIPALVLPAAALVALLMLGAIVMHAKVGDPIKRYIPAALMLMMSLGLAMAAAPQDLFIV